MVVDCFLVVEFFVCFAIEDHFNNIFGDIFEMEQAYCDSRPFIYS